MRSKEKVLNGALWISWKGRNLISSKISAVFSIKYLPLSSQQYSWSQTIISLLPVYSHLKVVALVLDRPPTQWIAHSRLTVHTVGIGVVSTYSVTGVIKTTEGLLLIQRLNWELSKVKWWFYHKAEQFFIITDWDFLHYIETLKHLDHANLGIWKDIRFKIFELRILKHKRLCKDASIPKFKKKLNLNILVPIILDKGHFTCIKTQRSTGLPLLMSIWGKA